MTLANFTKRTPWKAKRNKMNAVQVRDPVHGLFHSKREHARYHVLLIMQRAKEIRGLERQVKFSFDLNGIHIGTYRADFVYFKGEKRIVEDSKTEPSKTEAYGLRKRMMSAFYNIDILET